MATRDKKSTGNKHLTLKKEIDALAKCTKPTNEEKEESVVSKPKSATVGVKKGIWKRKLTSGLVGKHKNFNQIKKRQKGAKSSLDGPITDNLTGSGLIIAKKKRIRKRKLVLDEVNTKLKQNPPKLVREDEEDSTTTVNKDVKIELLSAGVMLTNCLSSQNAPLVGKSISDPIILTPVKSEKQMPTLKKRTPLQKEIDLSTEGSAKQDLEDSVQVPLSTQSKPKLRRRLKIARAVVASPELRNGQKVGASRYTTRSGVPPQLLRNGKPRKFKEPIALDEMDIHVPRRRKRLLSSTTDGSNVDSLNSSFVDGDSKMRIGSESDSSCLDSLQPENAEWDSDIEFKPSDILQPAKSLRRTSSPICSNGESLDAAGDKLSTNSRTIITDGSTLPDGDYNVDDDGDVFEESLETDVADCSRKIDSNSNLYEINKSLDGSSNSNGGDAKNKLKPIGNKLIKQKSSTITKSKSQSELHPLELLPSVPVVDINHFANSKHLETASLPGEGSSIPPVDRSATPDPRLNSDNWETISVHSTPSSKNFDVSFDDISEKDFSTDCENGKDVRRSQRSSIRKTRAALLKLATSGKRTGKSLEKADVDLLDDGNESEVQTDKPDELTDVESLMDVSLINSEIDGSAMDIGSEKDNVEDIEKLISTENQVGDSDIQGPNNELTQMDITTESKLEIHKTITPVAACSVSTLEKDLEVSGKKRQRVQSLNTQDIVALLDKGSVRSKERSASDFELSKTVKSTIISPTASGDISKFTLPVSKKLRLLAPKVSKNPNKNLAADLKPTLLSKEQLDVSKSEPKFPVFESANLKTELKVDIPPETSVAVGDATIPSPADSQVKLPVEMPPLTDPLCRLEDNKLDLVQDSINMEEEIKLIEAELRKEVEMKEFKESADGSNAINHVNVTDLMKDDVAEKLREISMKFQDDSDIFPSLNIKKSVVEETDTKSVELKQNGGDSLLALPPLLPVSPLLPVPHLLPVSPMPLLSPVEKLEDVAPLDVAALDVAASDIAASTVTVSDEETAEEKAIKESIFNALGLQSLEAARLAKIANVQRVRHDATYTGTLKTVIKVQRSPEKRTRPSKMKLNSDKKGDGEMKMNGFQYSIQSRDPEFSIEEPGTSTSTGFGNHISSNPQLFADVVAKPEADSSTEVATGDDEGGEEGDGAGGGTKQNLVIPEKASSFSIHPGRLCSDVCSYCFGKFGSLDTPCHVAQLKGSDRQVKILQAELHLTAESCLCDACYRHVDRKANCPSYKEKTKTKSKRLHHMSRAARPKAACCVQGCTQPAQHHVRRKWLTKLKRSIGKKVPVITSKLPQHTSLPLCSQHFAWVDHFMVCGICRRRLNCNQMYLLGPEVHEINTHLAADRIPVRLTEKVFLCKLCRYFTTLRMKFPNMSKLGGSNRMFYDSYRKKIFQSLDLEIPEEPAETEDTPKAKRRKLKSLLAKPEPAAFDLANSPPPQGVQTQATPTVPVITLTGRGAHSPPSVDVSDMVETQLVEPMIDYSNLPKLQPPANGVSFATPTADSLKPTKIRLKLGSVQMTKVGKDGKMKDNKLRDNKMTGGSVVIEQRPNPESLRLLPHLPPGVTESLNANFDFENPVIVRSDSEGEWEKCNFTLQYDRDSKIAFEKLRRPYGSQSSFFRHLLLLEQYWRSGEMMPSPVANPRTKSYLKSVHARIDSFNKAVPFHFPPTIKSAPNVPKVQNIPATVTAVPSASSSMPTNPSLPVIDLPIRRRLSGGVMTTSTAVRPVSSSPPFQTSGGSLISPGSSSNPLFISQAAPKKFVVNPVTGQMVATKRKPNIVQVTKGGQPLFRLVDPTKSQIRALQGYKRKVQSTSTVTSEAPEIVECTPMICDVRSLAAESTAKMWNTPPPATETSASVKLASVKLASGKPASAKPHALIPIAAKPQKIHPTILPKPPQGVGPKPNTVVTPTGIILSKKLDISVSPVVSKRQDLPPKT